MISTEFKYVLRGHKAMPETDLMRWAMWMEKADRHVKVTKLKKHFVSTVFLGMDHSLYGKVPLLFETIVFKNKLSRIKKYKYHQTVDDFMERYSTWEAAEIGHEIVVEKVKQYESK